MPLGRLPPAGPLWQPGFYDRALRREDDRKAVARYILTNPLRAGLVGSMHQLDQYRYCGHSVLMGKINNNWQDTHYVLKLFGKRVLSARKRYREFVKKGVKKGRRSDLTGGGLIRSTGGWTTLKSYRRQKIHVKGDERILGDSDFVESVLEEQNERLVRRYHLQAQGVDDLEHVVDDLLELVVLDLHRPVGPAVAEGVRHDHAVAGLEQRRGLVLPAAAVVRHAVDQHGDLVAFALIADMVVVTADLHYLSGEAHRFLLFVDISLRCDRNSDGLKAFPGKHVAERAVAPRARRIFAMAVLFRLDS